MSLFLIIIVIFLYSFQTLFCKLYTDRYPGKAELASPVFCVTEGIAVAALSFAAGGFSFNVSPLTLLFGLINALVLFGYNSSLIKASSKGSYAFMNVILLFGAIIVPSLYGMFFLGDELPVEKLIAIVFMLAACVLMNADEIKLKNTPVIYYVFCLLLFCFNGAYSVLVKLQTVYRDEEKQEMIMLTFGVMGIAAFIQLLAKEKKSTKDAFKLDKKSIIPLALCIASAGLAINLLVYIIPFVNTAVLYTVQNGGVLVLATVYSAVFFKEKMRPLKVIGIIVAVASMTVLSV